MNTDLESRIKENAVLLNVGEYRQQKKWACGPGALKIVLDFFGRELSEKELIKLCGANNKIGTTPDGLCAAFQSLGYRTFQQMNASIADIESFLMAGLPVIVAYQSLDDKPYGTVPDPNEDKRYGHYAVIMGANKTHFFLSNPEKDAAYDPIHKSVFLKSWWDKDLLERRLFNRWFIAAFPKHISFVYAEGDNYEIGLAVGQTCKEEIQSMLKYVKEDFEHKTKRDFSTFIDNAKKFLPYCKDTYPEYVRELEGMAQGAELDFDELWTLSCIEELDWNDDDSLLEKCSSLAARTKSGLVLAHNEDYYCYPTNSLYILKAKQKNKPSFLSVGYTGSLAGSSCGINDAGIAMSGNSISAPDNRFGVLKNFVCRKILDDKSPRWAVKHIEKTYRAIGGNYSVVSAQNSFFVETFARDEAVITVSKFPAFHTNHCISDKLIAKESSVSESSKQRYASLKRILKRMGDREFSIDDVKDVLSDHSDWPTGICRHDYEGEKNSGGSTTLASVILNPEKGLMILTNGSPCRTEYEEYAL